MTSEGNNPHIKNLSMNCERSQWGTTMSLLIHLNINISHILSQNVINNLCNWNFKKFSNLRWK